MTQRAAVFLDRDGVLNRAYLEGGKLRPPAALSELEILPGVADAVMSLREAGFLLIMATNQPDVVRGKIERSDVETINAYLQQHLGLDDIRVCYHDDADHCRCRKPLPGLLTSAALDHGISLGRSFMVGDRWRDVGAGKHAGCRTVLVENGWEEDETCLPDARVNSLLEAADWILHESRSDLR